MITKKQVREIFKYEPDGRLRRIKGGLKKYPSAKAGNGTLQAWALDRVYYVHHLVWIYHHGLPLPYHIDHVNRNKHDNRIENLRAATKSQNAANAKLRSDNTSGYKGVSFDKTQAGVKQWKAKISFKGKSITVGCFETAEKAYVAYKKAAIKYFGEFANPETI